MSSLLEEPHNLTIRRKNKDCRNIRINKYPPGPIPKIPGKLIRQFIRDPIKTLLTISQTYGDISYIKLGP